MMRLLLVGVLLCIGLPLGKVKPVEAADGLPPGKYKGDFWLGATSTTTKSASNPGSSFKGSVEVSWRLESGIQLEVSKDKVLFTMTSKAVDSDITQTSDNNYVANGKTCRWWHNIFASGIFTSMTSTPYAAETKSFTVPIEWLGTYKWNFHSGHSYGSGQGCETWGKQLDDTERDAIDEWGEQFKEITFTVLYYDSDIISGTCDLPKWISEAPKITDGEVKRVVHMCSWSVRPVGGLEWKKIDIHPEEKK
jgi:hypothetical protein